MRARPATLGHVRRADRVPHLGLGHGPRGAQARASARTSQPGAVPDHRGPRAHRAAPRARAQLALPGARPAGARRSAPTRLRREVVACSSTRFMTHGEALIHGDLHTGQRDGRRRPDRGHRPRVRVLRPGRLRPRRHLGERHHRGGARGPARPAGCLPGARRGDRPRVAGRVPDGARAACGPSAWTRSFDGRASARRGCGPSGTTPSASRARR